MAIKSVDIYSQKHVKIDIISGLYIKLILLFSVILVGLIIGLVFVIIYFEIKLFLIFLFFVLFIVLLVVIGFLICRKSLPHYLEIDNERVILYFMKKTVLYTNVKSLKIDLSYQLFFEILLSYEINTCFDMEYINNGEIKHVHFGYVTHKTRRYLCEIMGVK